MINFSVQNSSLQMRIRIILKTFIKERKGKERKGKERKGKERKGKERKGKERKGKERKKSESLPNRIYT